MPRDAPTASLSDHSSGLWALTVGGWDVSKASLYDEEGVEGWRWDGPNGEEFAETRRVGRPACRARRCYRCLSRVGRVN